MNIYAENCSLKIPAQLTSLDDTPQHMKELSVQEIFPVFLQGLIILAPIVTTIWAVTSSSLS
jgi:hypothetical protein